VPEYRVWPLAVRGHFFGPFGSVIQNASIPLACLPEKARKLYQRYECRQSIASIEAMLIPFPQGPVRVDTSDLALVLGNVYEHHSCAQAWAEFGTGPLVELLNSVRNRILDFTLAVWKEAPGAGEIGTSTLSTMETNRVTQIFNTTVYGGSANLVGASNASSIEFNIGPKDFSSLERVLIENGVTQEDVSELKVALDSESIPATTEKFGPNVANWIAKMVGKAATGGWSISLGAAGNLLAQAITKYYGL
jgi:AbiTii